jgi:ribosome maturation factor RimP
MNGEGTAVPFTVEIRSVMISKETVNQIVDEFLLDSELYLVDLKITPDNRILIEIDSFESISLDDCVALNRFIESKLDRDTEDYELEVSSAGLTEPFKVLNQYIKNIGQEVEIITREGQKMNGILQEANQDHFSVEIQKNVRPEGAKRKMLVAESHYFSYPQIKSTKLIITFK